MKNTALKALAVAMLATIPLVPLLAQATESHTMMMQSSGQAANVDSAKVVATKAVLRDLWLNHVFWVRNVVVEEISGNVPATKIAEAQVVANAQAIAGAIEPFYGAEAKEALFKLLAGHYGAVKAYLDASIAKDAAKQKEALDQLLANADQIATFLSGANPNLPKDVLLGLLQAHGGHHMNQIQQLIAKDYSSEAETWADMSQHMYTIADALADGIAEQFPQKF